MNKKPLAGLAAALLAIAAFAAVPVVAQATPAETITLVSGESNSLCVNAKGFEPFTGSNFGPITEPHSGGPFPDTGEACGTPGITHPFVGGAPGGPGFIYQARKLYGAAIAGAQWVSPYVNAEDRENPVSPVAPAYYIYDATFNLPCKSELETGQSIKGEMFADNVVGAFLNGHPIGNDTLAETVKNFVYPAAPFGTTNPADFNLGNNTLQFVVLDTSPPYTGMDFKATVKHSPCVIPRWGPNIGSKKVQTISWGKVTFNSPAGPVTCKKSDAGNIWNPEGGGAGLDETVLFNLYECQAGECPKGVTVSASGLPWPSELEEAPAGSGVIRDKTTGMSLAIECESRATWHYTGELAPKVVNGTKTKPTFEEFDEGSGALESPEGLAPLKVTGTDKMAGFEALELFTAKTERVEETKEEKAKNKKIIAEEKAIKKIEKTEKAKIEKEIKEREENEKREKEKEGGV